MGQKGFSSLPQCGAKWLWARRHVYPSSVTRIEIGRVRAPCFSLHGFTLLISSFIHWLSDFSQIRQGVNTNFTRVMKSLIEVAIKNRLIIEATAAVDCHCCRNFDAAVGVLRAK